MMLARLKHPKYSALLVHVGKSMVWCIVTLNMQKDQRVWPGDKIDLVPLKLAVKQALDVAEGDGIYQLRMTPETGTYRWDGPAGCLTLESSLYPIILFQSLASLAKANTTLAV
ncbi:hypothetical protein HAX54_010572 [Datura stramonium]|uniref:Uncharacterized protein n=1 Tax=Datura stramonium TaxID=4076 RepID=A0ABS8THH2_DATST|nr:hypothetical protein [Datura stramonium]